MKKKQLPSCIRKVEVAQYFLHLHLMKHHRLSFGLCKTAQQEQYQYKITRTGRNHRYNIRIQLARTCNKSTRLYTFTLSRIPQNYTSTLTTNNHLSPPTYQVLDHSLTILTHRRVLQAITNISINQTRHTLAFSSSYPVPTT